MHVGADAAGALGEVGGVAGITALEDKLKAAEELSGGPDVLDLALLDFSYNFV